jgi:hypothetical protein
MTQMPIFSWFGFNSEDSCCYAYVRLLSLLQENKVDEDDDTQMVNGENNNCCHHIMLLLLQETEVDEMTKLRW